MRSRGLWLAPRDLTFSSRMDRRSALRTMLALSASMTACAQPKEQPMTTARDDSTTRSAAKMPVIFAAHGAPILLDDASWMAELAAWAQAMPRPKNVLVISAHWEKRPAAIGATKTIPLVYDFYGFPQRYYDVTYPSPGAPELASQIETLLRGKSIGVVRDETRGLDHGAYVPLVAMYPKADVPVLQLSLPGLDPSRLVEMGRALAPLRDEGTLIFGSGFLTHNMRYGLQRGTPAWAREFDHWSEHAIATMDLDALMDFRRRAPAADTALPTWEHYAPLLVSAGASQNETSIAFPIRGFWMDGAFTRRSVQFG